MPRGSKGEKRPADTIGNTVHVIVGPSRDGLSDHIGISTERAYPTRNMYERASRVSVQGRSTVKSGDFANVLKLAEARKDQFAFCIMLYDSSDFAPFGDKLAAAPLSSL